MSRFVSEIKKYLTEHDEIKAVSFDLFNTLLLRYAAKPEDVFEEVGKSIKLPVGVSAEDYKYIRWQTQKEVQAVKKCRMSTSEVSLKDITDSLPSWINSKEAMEAEIRVESELVFCNPEITDFVRWLEEKGYEIIYVSDMYLSAEQIKSVLLTNGAPRHRIFVSNEFEVDKKSGQLFESAMYSIGKTALQLIHIGDNFEADVLGAEKCGIRAFHYKAPYEDASSGIAMEEFILGGRWTDKNILRHIASGFSKSNDDEMNKWFSIGAEIVGPVAVYFMEWLSGQIKQKEDNLLLFFMREGSFFRKAWQIYSRHHNINVESKLVYISRRAMLLPMMKQFDEEELQLVLEQPQISLGEVFRILGITKWEEPFDVYLNVQSKDFEKIKVKGISLYQVVKDFLLSEKNVLVIETSIKNEKEKAQAYFKSLGLKGKVATVDIGYQGTIQKRLEKVVFAKDEIQWHHFLLLCNGLKRLEELDRSNIMGALGTYCGEGSDLMSVVNRNNRSLELLFLEGCGSCIGYAEREGKAVPVLEPLYWPEKQKRQIENCQKGALAYLQLYLKSGKKRTWRQEEILRILYRFLSSPSYLEAELLGQLVFDENNGTQYTRQICEKKDIEKIKQMGMEEWQQESDYNSVQWIEGLLTLGNPAGILQQGRNIRGYNESYSLNLVEKLLRKKEDCVYIVAAGTVGRLVAKYAGMVNIHIKAFVDNNPRLQGKNIKNIPVIPIEKCEKDGSYVIASIPYKEELKKQVLKYVEDNASIIC